MRTTTARIPPILQCAYAPAPSVCDNAYVHRVAVRYLYVRLCLCVHQCDYVHL